MEEAQKQAIKDLTLGWMGLEADYTNNVERLDEILNE